MRLVSTFKFDASFQIRHGFYYAYALVTVFYVACLHYIPASYKESATTLLIASDPAVLGFYFIGGLVLLERSQNTMASLFVTPMRITEYLIAKAGSLGMLSVVTSFAIALLALGADFNFGLLFLGVGLTSVFFTLVGLSIAVHAKSLNQFLFMSSILGAFFIPVLGYVGLVETETFRYLPLGATLAILEAALSKSSEVAWTEIFAAAVVLLLWIVAAFALAHRWFRKYVIMRIGGGQ